MSVEIADTFKNTLVMLFDDESLGAHISDHPMVQVWGWYWVAAIISGISGLILGFVGWIPFVPFIVGILAWTAFFSATSARLAWSVAYAWNGFWWGLLLSLFFSWFWLWILDAWGWLEMDWVYQIFAPLNGDGNYGIVDDWVSANTWTFKHTIEVIEKEQGVSFDANNDLHMQKLKDFTWPYLYEQMNMLNFLESSMWFTNTFWFLLCPTMYVDDDGNALDGYPLMMAKSNQLSLMYLGDYSWMQDPYNRKIPLDLFTWFGTLLNICLGFIIYKFQLYFLGDIPALISIFYQFYIYFFKEIIEGL